MKYLLALLSLSLFVSCKSSSNKSNKPIEKNVIKPLEQQERNLHTIAVADSTYQIEIPFGDVMIVSKNRFYGVWNKVGKWILPVKYDSIIHLRNESSWAFMAKSNEGWKLFSLTGELLNSQVYSSLENYGGKKLLLGINGKKYLASFSNSEISLNETQEIDNIYSYYGMYVYEHAHKYGIWISSGEDWLSNGKRTEAIYDSIYYIGWGSLELFPVEIDGKYGVIDINGAFVVETDFNKIKTVSQSHVYFKNKRGWFRFSNGQLNKLTKDELDRFTKGLERDSIYRDYNEKTN